MQQIKIDAQILPWSRLLSASKTELIELYWEQARKGVSVYFENEEGKWLLDSKGDLKLQKK